MQNNQTTITEAELRTIVESVTQQILLDEDWRGFFKGVGSALGKKTAQAGRAVGNAAANAGRAVGNAAANAGRAINKQYQDVKTAGQQASMQSDHRRNLQKIEKQNQKIIAQLQAWQQQGVFVSRQANSAVAQLIKALQNNYNQTQANQDAEYNARFNNNQQ